MSSISNDKKTALCIAGLVLLVIGAVLALTVGQDYQDRKTAITNLYDQCMDDDYLLPIVEGTDNREKFCQCRAKMMHDADMDLMTTQEIAVDMNLISASVVLNDITGYETSTEGLANIGSYFYCGMTTGEEE